VFIDAFNARDIDAFAGTLHPEVELHTGRGLRIGIEAARDWATRTPGGVQQEVLVEDVREDGHRVLVLIVREWRWADEETRAEPAHADAMAWLFEFRDGRIVSWRPFEEREDAFRALAAD
jgi:ketosteroid isomerase-like protein